MRNLPHSMDWTIAKHFDAILAEGLCMSAAEEVVRIIWSNLEVLA